MANNNAPIGTEKAGYATPEHGPFKCANCVHYDGAGRCDHPDVVEDPAVKGEVQPSGCCNYFRDSQ